MRHKTAHGRLGGPSILLLAPLLLLLWPVKLFLEAITAPCEPSTYRPRRNTLKEEIHDKYDNPYYS